MFGKRDFFALKRAGIAGALLVMGTVASSPVMAEQTQATGAAPLSTNANLDFRVVIPVFCQLKVGSAGNVIDLVDFDLSAAGATVGDGNPVNRTNGGAINVTVRSNTSGTPTLAANAPGDLSNGATGTIPYSKIAVSVSNVTGSIPHAADVGNSTAQNVTLSGNQAEANWTYQYVNDTVPQAGTYGGVNTNNSRVPYTLTCP